MLSVTIVISYLLCLSVLLYINLSYQFILVLYYFLHYINLSNQLTPEYRQVLFPLRCKLVHLYSSLQCMGIAVLCS